MSETNETTSRESLSIANGVAGLIYVGVLVMVAAPFFILYDVPATYAGALGAHWYIVAFEGIAAFILGFLAIILMSVMPPKGVRSAWHIGALILACLVAIGSFPIWSKFL